MFQKEIRTNGAPAPIGPYSQAIKLSDFVYLSGQLGIDPVTNTMAGSDIKSQTHQSLQNILSLLQEMGLGFGHVVKTTVFLSDMSLFNEFNEVYAQYFTAPYPARSCVAVKSLPKDGLVEIECLVIDTLPYEQAANGCSCEDCQGDCENQHCENEGHQDGSCNCHNH